MEQMFNSFTVIFHERWDPLGTRSAQELYAWRAEAAKRAALTFLHDVCLEQARPCRERRGEIARGSCREDSRTNTSTPARAYAFVGVPA